MAYYNLFISHAWKYNDDYDRLVNLLNSENSFSWLNWSAPEDKPAIPEGMVAPNQVVLDAIARKINMSDCVLVISGMYVNHSDWILAEMEIAQKLGKPLIGVEPWGSERVPSAVREKTNVDIGWQTSSVIQAVRTYCKLR